jgi:ABC-type transport system involved in multi-copper enzyme maturation permease subunit
VNEQLTSPIRGRDRANGALIVVPPVLVRELRAALHRRDAKKSRSRVARFGVIGVALFMLVGAASGTTRWGATLHFYLLIAGLSLAVGPALQISVGLFAEERRQQTLELLYLTGMGSAELFAGKLLSGVLLSSSEFMALGPLLALPFLSGGVSFDLFVATLACLPTVFVMVLAIGALSSALCRQEGAAFVVSGVLMGVFCLALSLPYNLGLWLNGKIPFDKTWLTLSPALGPWILAHNFGGFRVSDFWVWTAVTWGLSTACLALAAATLKRNWRRGLQGTSHGVWRSRWEAFVLGSASGHEDLRRSVLDKNAYQWLAQHDRRPVFQAWAFIAAVCMFWLLGWCMWPTVWPSPLSFYTLAMVLLFGRDVFLSYAAARRMSADRRDGTLELLLTTPLSPEEMLSGQRAALDQQFRTVKRGLCGLMLLMAFGGFLCRSFTVPGIVSYLAVWCIFFTWCWRSAHRSVPLAMWVAANCGRPLYGAFRKGGAWSRIWMFYYFSMMANALGSLAGRTRTFPSGSIVEMIVILAVVFWILLFMFANRKSSDSVAQSLVSQLRLIAQEPLPDRNDPRFKQWKDVRTRFPAPSGGRFGFPGEDLSETKPIKPAAAWFWRPVGRACGLAWGKLQRTATRR